MVLLAIGTGLYSKCHYFFFPALWLYYFTFYNFYNLNHGPSSMDHFDLKPRQNYNLMTYIFVTYIFSLPLVPPTNFIEIQLLLQSLHAVPGNSWGCLMWAHKQVTFLIILFFSPKSWDTLRPHGMQHARLPCASLSRCPAHSAIVSLYLTVCTVLWIYGRRARS